MCRMPALSPYVEGSTKPHAEEWEQASLLGATEDQASAIEHELRAEASVEFDEACESHKLVLQRLWDLAFPEHRGKGLRWRGPEWLTIGFQSDDPLRDLRGSGYHLYWYLPWPTPLFGPTGAAP